MPDFYGYHWRRVIRPRDGHTRRMVEWTVAHARGAGRWHRPP